MRIVCQQTILMKYHALFMFEKAAKFEIVVCCKLKVALEWLKGKSLHDNLLKLPLIY